MSACGYTPAQIDDMPFHDVLSLFAYWREFPPMHEILKSVFQIERAADRTPIRSDSDPSGIGGLISRYPNGLVQPNESG